MHAVYGNVYANTVLEGARWAVTLAERLSKTVADKRADVARSAHQERLQALLKDRANVETNGGTRHLATESQFMILNAWSNRMTMGYPAHQKLSTVGLPPLDSVYRYFFEKVLGERVSDEDVRIVDAKSFLRNRAPNVLGN